MKPLLYPHVALNAAKKITRCVKCGLSNTYWERWPSCNDADLLPPGIPYDEPAKWYEIVTGIILGALAFIGALFVLYTILTW